MFSFFRFISLFLFITSALIVGSCSSAKKQHTKKEAKTKKEDSVLVAAKKNNIEFEWLKSKADVLVLTSKESIDFNVTLRMKKDSVIWLSISKLGFNVAKALLSKDSLILLDKFNGKYYKGDYSYVRDSLNFAVDFFQIQALLLGNFHPLYSPDRYKAISEDNHQIYSTLSKVALENIIRNNTFSSGTEQINTIWLSKDTSKVERVYYQDPIKKYILDVYYFSRKDGKKPFPKEIEMSLKNGNVSDNKINIKYSKTEISDKPLEIDITIPADYVPIK